MGTNFYTPDGKHVGKRSAAGQGRTHFTWCTDQKTGAGCHAASARAKVSQCKYVRANGGKMTPEEFFENVVSKCSTFSESNHEFV